MKYLITLVLIGLAVFGFLKFKQGREVIDRVKINDTVINVEVADTDAERGQGLSGREKLEEDSGMLFVFEKEGNYGFWMKDMKFPIDIAWLDQNKKIIHLESNVSPATYPTIFQPTEKSLYVLELPASFLDLHGIKVGDRAEF